MRIWRNGNRMNMETNNIQNLLDRYFEGATTLAEEQKLKEFFAGDQIPQALQEYRPLFVGLKEMQQDQLSADFEARLLDRLDDRPVAKVRSIRPMLMRIAAAVVLLLGLWFLIPKNGIDTPPADGIDWTAYEVTDEEAVEEALAALRLLSEKLNSGKKTVQAEMSNVERVYAPMQ
jgi:hypothetical protein